MLPSWGRRINMFRLVVFVVAVSFTSHWIQAIDDSHTDQIWEAFKEKHNKTYDSPEEEEKRRDTFEENMIHSVFHNMVDEHNYTKDVHPFSDMTPEEMIKTLCGLVDNGGSNATETRDFSVSERQIPSSVNWLEKKKVTRVKNQGGCGSCWTFSATGALEGQAAIKWDYGLWEINEQQIVDCAGEYGGGGCNGGSNDIAYNYIQNKGGLVEEYCYPYTAKDGTCHATDEDKKKCYHFGISRYVKVEPHKDEYAVAKALAEIGPLSIGIWVSNDFCGYSSGIFHDKNWNNNHGRNHAVLLVGYGSENGQDYWLIKNSWGEGWGEKGYIRVARNANNMIDVAGDATYPVI